MFVTKLQVHGDSNHDYDITLHEDGTVHCTCPAWKFHNGDKPANERTCKHIKFVAAKLAAKS